ncbi:MBL fold metallo-hydrolase [Sporomusa sphaeroides]|uniref:MBL fold metallo-hydrolase n=1 Tax=Sporomusa sphaeroides TaxID=47679 RepID=UPI0020309F33|nr:MBL fold metallo-hydrolase [Sporomusa sphaeroides]MCM0757420.1 MBL fold metallo-hydrolase [Sporomusa sphaeroides DSM 2875]HML33814.1 MBL fold metallo-hydrolase [Sporomusa sphaeroides]
MEIKVLASSSGGNAYRIDDGQTPLLLDAGIPFKELKQRLNFRVSEIVGALITHEHMDHAKAVNDLMKAGIDCYMSAGTAAALDIISHRLKILKSKEQFKLGTWTVLPFDIQHDVAEPLGFLLGSGRGKLLYATDTYYIRYKFPGLTHIMIECNHSADILRANVESGVIPEAHKNRLIQSHFSLENVKAFLKANDLSLVREIHLIHLSAGNSDAMRFKREIQEVTGKPVYVAGE